MDSAATERGDVAPRLGRGGARAEAHRLKGVLAAFARSSAAWMHGADFDELAARITEAIVGDDDYLMAVVGLVERGPDRAIRWVAAAGSAAGYLEGLSFSGSEDRPDGRGPLGRAVRSGAPYVMRDSAREMAFRPWRARARCFGIRSGATVPFGADGRVTGVIEVYSADRQAFGPRELDVFAKLGRELAFAVSLREDRCRLREAEDARRLAEEAARSSREELGRAARLLSIGEFASSVAHEVNQPVGAIMTNANAALRWLDRAEPDLAEVRSALQRIVRDAGRASDVIRSARAKLVRAPQAGEPLDINVVLSEALQFVRNEHGQEGVEIETHLSPGLPPVVGDRVQLQQVAVNLFVNALDAMSQVMGRRRLLSVSTGYSDADGVCVSIADTGCGFNDGDGEQVFEHFFTTKAEGLGLGLPISRSIVEAYGGVLTAAANTPHGAIFTFSIPTAPHGR